MIWQVAARNLLRNFRRSAMTTLAIGVSGMAILLFGGFVTSIWFGLQTSIVQEQGHIQIFQEGYNDFGAVDPDAYTIDDYQAVIDSIEAAPDLSREIHVMTPEIAFGGIAGNAVRDSSKTFIGRGVVPSDVNRMRQWDRWDVGVSQPDLPMSNDDIESAVIGVGMARMIGLCEALEVPDCQDPPSFDNGLAEPAGSNGREVEDFSDLTGAMGSDAPDTDDSRPQLDLLAASSGGAPNIVSVRVEEAMPQAIRALDESMVMLHFDQARQLLYANDPKATSIIVQVNDPDHMDALGADLREHLQMAGFNMEVLTFNEVDPTFGRVFGMFTFIFGAISVVLTIVIVFTIINTVTMNVMERIKEVGTIRSMGLRRSNVFRQFMAESFVLGAAGAIVSLLLAIGASTVLNDANITWTPPSNATPLVIQLMVTDNLQLMLGTVTFLIAITVIASILPTLNAVRTPIVKALQHA